MVVRDSADIRRTIQLILLFASISLCLLCPDTLNAWEKPSFWKKPKAGDAPTNTKGESQKEITKKGKAVYRQRCSVCHGRTGQGDGEGSVVSGIPPTDLTNKAYMSLFSDRELFERIKFGEERFPYLQMTGYADYMSSNAIWSVISYVRSLEKDKGPLKVPTPQERAENFTDPLERGKIYYLRYCSPCHGITGDGKGWAARISGGKPIAHNDPIVMSRYSRQQIYNHVKGLRRNNDWHMPVFGQSILPKVVKEIAIYTKLLPENLEDK